VGAYLAGLGPLLGPMVAALGRLGAKEVGLGPKWSVLGGVRADKCANAEQAQSAPNPSGNRPKKGQDAEASEASFSATDFSI